MDVADALNDDLEEAEKLQLVIEVTTRPGMPSTGTTGSMYRT